MKRFLIAAASLMALSVPAHSAVVLSDNFDAENGGNSALNYTGFANFNVNGKVDLVKSGTYNITCSGSCVDLDGTTGPGEIASKLTVYFNAGDILTLTFDLGGSERVVAGVDDWYATFITTLGDYGSFGTIGSGDPFSAQTITWTATGSGSGHFVIGTKSADKVGALVDNVALDVTRLPVPEPTTWAMMIGGFALVGASLRRRKAVVSFA